MKTLSESGLTHEQLRGYLTAAKNLLRQEERTGTQKSAERIRVSVRAIEKEIGTIGAGGG